MIIIISLNKNVFLITLSQISDFKYIAGKEISFVMPTVFKM